MKRIVLYLSFLAAWIIFSWCSNLNHTNHLDQQNHFSWAINFQNWTFDRAPFSDERTWDEWSYWVTVTTIQELWNGDFAQIHWLSLMSWTTLTYSGYNYMTPRDSSAYKDIFKNQSGYTFVYTEVSWNPQIAIKIYHKNILKSLPENIFSGLCMLYDQSWEWWIPKWTKFWYKPSSKYQEQIDTYRKDQNTTIDSEISKIMETSALSMMYPCEFPNAFQIIWDYIVAGWFWWKNGWWGRWWWLNTIEIVKQ